MLQENGHRFLDGRETQMALQGFDLCVFDQTGLLGKRDPLLVFHFTSVSPKALETLVETSLASPV